MLAMHLSPRWRSETPMALGGEAASPGRRILKNSVDVAVRPDPGRSCSRAVRLARCRSSATNRRVRTSGRRDGGAHLFQERSSLDR